MIITCIGIKKYFVLYVDEFEGKKRKDAAKLLAANKHRVNIKNSDVTSKENKNYGKTKKIDSKERT